MSAAVDAMRDCETRYNLRDMERTTGGITVLDLGSPPDAEWCLHQLQEVETGCWFDRRATKGVSLVMIDPDCVVRSADGLWAVLDADAGKAGAGPFGFAGGWAGFISYEAALSALGFAEEGGQTAVGHYPAALVFDHALNRAYAVGRGPEGAVAAHRLASRLRGSPSRSSSATFQVPRVLEDGPSEIAFVEQVRVVQDWIEAGDVYVANLTYRIHLDGLNDPAAAYARLSSLHPAPYAAIMRHGEHWVLSSSPELLIQRRGEHAWTRPIKGTRPAREARMLVDDPKERAELAMIVDMERNDLGQVACVGSVYVRNMFGVESHPGLVHLVATVAANVRCPAGRLLRAMLPGGSITGAPKKRAVQLLRGLEADRRGLYTGTIGFCDDGGDLEWNVAIRTFETTREECRYGTGGGITIDSNPRREYAETRLKAAGPLRALGVPWG